MYPPVTLPIPRTVAPFEASTRRPIENDLSLPFKYRLYMCRDTGQARKRERRERWRRRSWRYNMSVVRWNADDGRCTIYPPFSLEQILISLHSMDSCQLAFNIWLLIWLLPLLQ